MDIESVEALRTALGRGVPLGRLRLQGLDLRDHADVLTGRDDVEGLVVLGGLLPAALGRHLTRHGAVVLPPAPHAPVDPYRAHLYTPDELYAGLAEHGYDATPDARAYAWSRSAHLRHDAYVAVLRATHDAAMDDALDEFLRRRQVVGVMGGHAVRRGDAAYAEAAGLGHHLARAGLVVATGGGPGAMEAANLGAFAPDDAALGTALAELAAVPSFTPDVGAWAALGLRVRAELERAREEGGRGRADRVGSREAPRDGARFGAGGPGAPGEGVGEVEAGRRRTRVRSVGIPTWFYGHEPPNVFCDGVAKFFSNAVREDGLLARCTAGIVVLRGAAGTVQEIFQAATPRYYAAPDDTPAPLVLVGADYWTREVPVWDALVALGAASPLGATLHLVDDLAEAARIVGDHGRGSR